jgi:hypothetical protein
MESHNVAPFINDQAAPARSQIYDYSSRSTAGILMYVRHSFDCHYVAT